MRLKKDDWLKRTSDMMAEKLPLLKDYEIEFIKEYLDIAWDKGWADSHKTLFDQKVSK